MSLVVSQLKRFHPLDAFSDDRCKELLSIAKIKTLSSGMTLFEKGDPGSDTLFLLKGALLERYPDGHETRITAGSDKAKFAIGNLLPRQFTAISDDAETEIIAVRRELLEKFITWSQMSESDDAMTVVDLDLSPAAAPSDWMSNIMQTRLFQELPTESIAHFFAVVESVPVKSGETIVTQGDPGDYYYMIREGRAQVLRSAGNVEFEIAELSTGAAFGEEALVTEQPRNATVRMITQGVLMRLPAHQFRKLLHKPIVRYVSAKEAKSQYRKGGVTVIDVRGPDEYGRNSIRGSINIPLFRLRGQIGALHHRRRYILCCDTGRRSAAAAFLMRERGLEVSVLKGGIASLASRPPTR